MLSARVVVVASRGTCLRHMPLSTTLYLPTTFILVRGKLKVSRFQCRECLTLRFQGMCSAGEEGAARLVSRVDVNGYVTGTLQVFFEGAWGAVCGSNFDDRDAMVACRQLGFSGGISVKNPSGFLTPSPASPVRL